jgi:hypothetical protein
MKEKSEQIRVARFFSVNDTKTGKKVPNEHERYQTVIKYPKNVHKILQMAIKYIQGPPKFTRTGIFGLKINNLAALEKNSSRGQSSFSSCNSQQQLQKLPPGFFSPRKTSFQIMDYLLKRKKTLFDTFPEAFERTFDFGGKDEKNCFCVHQSKRRQRALGLCQGDQMNL